MCRAGCTPAIFTVWQRRSSLAASGLVHAIGCNAPRNDHDPFIQTYIFPGSNQPRLSEIARHLEANPLLILLMLKTSFVTTATPSGAGWSGFTRMPAAWTPSRYDARFRRMWEYYLSCGIAAAAVSDAAVYQVSFTNDSSIDMPLARV